MKNGSRQRGLTRTEVVVVGGCLALLTLVILPALTNARDAGKRAVCLANLKTLGAAALLYARDYEDKIPCWGIEFDECAIHGTGSWNYPDPEQLAHAFEWGYLWEYVQTRSPFTCPSLTNKMNPKKRVGISLHSAEVWGWPGTDQAGNLPGPMWSYEVNGQAAYSMNDPLWRVNPELVLPNPAGVMMLFEQDYQDYAAFDNSVSLCNPTYDTRNNAEDSVGRYHKVSGVIGQPGGTSFNNTKGNGNIVFFDGHVEEMSIEDFIIQRSTAQGTLELYGGYIGFIWPGF